MIRLLLVAAVLLSPLPGFAQQGGKHLYRCGNNYQDRPCDGSAPAAKAGSPAAAPSTAPAAAAQPPSGNAQADAQKAAAPMTKAQQQRQIRCENFGRQRDELRDRMKSDPKQADAIGLQIKSLESRMAVDSCG